MFTRQPPLSSGVMHLIDRTLFVFSCLWSMWATGSAAAFDLFGWPEDFLRWPHRTPNIDAIPLWYLAVSLLVVAALFLAYLLRLRFRTEVIVVIYSVGLALFLGFGYWSGVMGLQFFLPFFGARLFRQESAGA